jgi:hypothetical protein
MLDQASAFRPLALDRTSSALYDHDATGSIARRFEDRDLQICEGWPAPLFPNRNLGSILSKSGSGLALRTVRVSDEAISLTEIFDPVVGEMAIFQQLALILR